MSSEPLPAVPMPQRVSNVNISSHYTLKSVCIFDHYTSSLFSRSNDMSNAVGDLIHVYIPNTSESQEISDFLSVAPFACVYFRCIALRTRRGRAELNKSATICSLKAKLETNQHKSSHILCGRCASRGFFCIVK